MYPKENKFIPMARTPRRNSNKSQLYKTTTGSEMNDEMLPGDLKKFVRTNRFPQTTNRRNRCGDVFGDIFEKDKKIDSL